MKRISLIVAAVFAVVVVACNDKVSDSALKPLIEEAPSVISMSSMSYGDAIASVALKDFGNNSFSACLISTITYVNRVERTVVLSSSGFSNDTILVVDVLNGDVQDGETKTRVPTGSWLADCEAGGCCICTCVNVSNLEGGISEYWCPCDDCSLFLQGIEPPSGGNYNINCM